MSKTRPCKHCGIACDDYMRGISENAHMRGVHCRQHIHPDCLLDPVMLKINKSDAYHAIRMMDDRAYDMRVQAGGLISSMPQTSRDLDAKAGVLERVAEAIRSAWWSDEI